MLITKWSLYMYFKQPVHIDLDYKVWVLVKSNVVVLSQQLLANIQYSSVQQAGQSQNVLECCRKTFPLSED